MINWLASRINRPERQWDPVPDHHVATYAAAEWHAGASAETLDVLERWLGGFAGKSILDLGGGPGQYSVAFAKRGGIVTWHDISRRYRDLASRRAADAGVSIRFSVGYMDEAAEILSEQFDLVFNRICWCYSRGDRSFSRVIWGLVKPGGSAYVDAPADRSEFGRSSTSARIRMWLNDRCWLKIGHPFPPPGRVAQLFAALPISELSVDRRFGTNDRVLFRKALPAA